MKKNICDYDFPGELKQMSEERTGSSDLFNPRFSH